MLTRSRFLGIFRKRQLVEFLTFVGMNRVSVFGKLLY